MSDVEDVTPHVKVEVEGAEELAHLGEIGAKAFADIISAASQGNLTGLMTMAFGELGGVIAEATKSVLEFVDAQASAAETLSNLATATGMTVPEIEGMKDAFASVGISTNGFERAIGRLAMTIGNEWSQIQQSVRTSADAQTGAMEQIQQTSFNVQKAYEGLNTAFETASRNAAGDALAIQSAAISLAKAADELNNASSEMNHNAQGVESATLSLQRAKLNLAKDQGFDVTADEKALKLQQDKLAVKEQEQRLADASHKQATEALDLEAKQLAVAKAKQEAQNAAAKQIQDSITGMNAIKQAQMDIAKAQLANREAQEKAYELDLKDIAAISKQVEEVVDKHKTWDQVVNHAEISAQNLTKAIILAASAGTNEVPTTKAVWNEMSSLFANMGDSADAMSKKLEIVQKLMGAGFRAGQASAAQMLAILERGPDALEKFNKEAEAFSKTKLGFNKEDVESLKEFNSAWAQLNAILDQAKAHFAAILATNITPFLVQMKESLEDENGTLNHVVQAVGVFVEALGGAIKVIGTLISWISQAIEWIGKMFGLTPVQAWIVVIGAVVVAIAGIPAAIGLVLLAIGEIVARWNDVWAAVKQAASDFANWFFGETFVGKIILGITLIINKIKDWIAALFGAKKAQDDVNAGKTPDKVAATASGAVGTDADKQAAQQQLASAQAEQKSAQSLDTSAQHHEDAANSLKSGGENITASSKDLAAAAQLLKELQPQILSALGVPADKLGSASDALTQAATALQQAAATKSNGASGAAAEGGLIRGPGGPTEDRAGLFALSDGEYVVRSAAVSHYGPQLFSALNDLAVGGFATGGMVGGGVRAPGGTGSGAGPSSVLNLTIDGQHFNGLKAPEHVAAKLKTYAVTRQSSSAGKMPTWMR